jgi:hypothetical protein
MGRYAAILPKLEEANRHHLPYGEMRGALRAVLAGLPPHNAPAPAPQPTVQNTSRPIWERESEFQVMLRNAAWAIGLCVCLLVFALVRAGLRGWPLHPNAPAPPVNLPEFKTPDWRTLTPEEYRLMEPGLRLRGIEPPQFFKDRLNAPRLPVAPPPREATKQE